MAEKQQQEIDVLIENGFERNTALELLKRFGSAERVLLSQVCGESNVEEAGKLEPDREAELGERYEQIVQAAKHLDWEGVDIRRQKRFKGAHAADLADAILSQGVGFLQQSVGQPSVLDDRKDNIVETNQARSTVERSEDSNVVVVQDESIAKIVDMGFSPDQAMAALVQCDGDLDQALALLLG